MPARLSVICIVACIFSMPGFALASDPLVLSIHDGHFEPEQLVIPAGIKVELVIRNLDAMPAEFESTDLSREIVVRSHGEAKIFVGPLDPGSYHFFNDFNRDMQGTIVAKPAANKEN